MFPAKLTASIASGAARRSSKRPRSSLKLEWPMMLQAISLQANLHHAHNADRLLVPILSIARNCNKSATPQLWLAVCAGTAENSPHLLHSTLVLATGFRHAPINLITLVSRPDYANLTRLRLSDCETRMRGGRGGGVAHDVVATPPPNFLRYHRVVRNYSRPSITRIVACRSIACWPSDSARAEVPAPFLPPLRTPRLFANIPVRHPTQREWQGSSCRWAARGSWLDRVDDARSAATGQWQQQAKKGSSS